jgi:hypothetical protein
MQSNPPVAPTGSPARRRKSVKRGKKLSVKGKIKGRVII